MNSISRTSMFLRFYPIDQLFFTHQESTDVNRAYPLSCVKHNIHDVIFKGGPLENQLCWRVTLLKNVKMKGSGTGWTHACQTFCPEFMMIQNYWTKTASQNNYRKTRKLTILLSNSSSENLGCCQCEECIIPEKELKSSLMNRSWHHHQQFRHPCLLQGG